MRRLFKCLRVPRRFLRGARCGPAFQNHDGCQVWRLKNEQAQMDKTPLFQKDGNQKVKPLRHLSDGN